MITTLGKTHIQTYLAGLTPSMAQSIVLGVSNTAATINDTEMSFEAARIPITSATVDPVSRKITFKGTYEGGALSVYEIGLSSSLADQGETTVVTDFNGITDAWVGGTDTESANSRIGTSLLNVSVAANTTPVAITAESYAGDLSDYLGLGDAWKIALHKSAATNLTFTLRVFGGSGYLDIIFPSTTATGYIFLKTAINPADATAGFDPENVTSYTLTATPAAGNATAATVGYDAIIAENALSSRASDVLIGRAVTSLTKADGIVPVDVEYQLGVTL